MLYYWLHIIYVYIGSKFLWKRVNLAKDFSRIRRVSVLDCDAFRFMANSKYFYYMDLIRLEITFRTDLYKNTIKKGKYPVIGSQKIIYKKPLKRWTKFKITLILEGWDDNWVYHRQVFSRNNEVYAIGFTKVGFWYKHKIQDIKPIILESGITQDEMPVSEEVLNFFTNDYNILKTSKK
ncbi:thioesterase family protein [Seonamhaeicola sp. MEBiC1930]|uniref:acyl-CoA thioesterase n=1 Tax=Seonamhaeicola sp. MEBiC01930 TaxID=2976768 RepID=UPI00324397D2